ncbi:MAG: SDR family NAD(P)-dependent oxidoreductase, partial [Cyanobacteriota bacterium]|nr:SDR family NAD(P)-dependent oxidoreductase [Cyanobacteriota bacterium]
MTAQEARANQRVLVTGATGGVGQLTVATLLEKGYQVRVLTRSPEKAQKMFDNRVEIAIGDIRQPTTLPPTVQNIT